MAFLYCCSRRHSDFPTTHQVLLEQNYRSTASILKACLKIVAQGNDLFPSINLFSSPSDKTRIPKSLHTAHASGTTPNLLCLESEYAEAAFIASEIKRLVAHTGGMLKWGDFVILRKFSFTYLIRDHNACLQSVSMRYRVPSRVLYKESAFLIGY